MALPDDIYEAVLRPEMWPSVLRSIAHELGAKDMSIGAHDTRTGHYEALSLPIDPVFEKSYAEYWAPRNFLWRGTARLPVGELFSFETVLPREQFARTDFYNEWWRPQGMEHALGSNLVVEGSLSAVATVYRPGSADAFDTGARRRFGQLLPHLQRAMQLRGRLAEVEVARDDLRRTLAALGKPALLVDPHCRILFANPPPRG